MNGGLFINDMNYALRTMGYISKPITYRKVPKGPINNTATVNKNITDAFICGCSKCGATVEAIFQPVGRMVCKKFGYDLPCAAEMDACIKANPLPASISTGSMATDDLKFTPVPPGKKNSAVCWPEASFSAYKVGWNLTKDCNAAGTALAAGGGPTALALAKCVTKSRTEAYQTDFNCLDVGGLTCGAPYKCTTKPPPPPAPPPPPPPRIPEACAAPGCATGCFTSWGTVVSLDKAGAIAAERQKRDWKRDRLSMTLEGSDGSPGGIFCKTSAPACKPYYANTPASYGTNPPHMAHIPKGASLYNSTCKVAGTFFRVRDILVTNCSYYNSTSRDSRDWKDIPLKSMPGCGGFASQCSACDKACMKASNAYFDDDAVEEACKRAMYAPAVVQGAPCDTNFAAAALPLFESRFSVKMRGGKYTAGIYEYIGGYQTWITTRCKVANKTREQCMELVNTEVKKIPVSATCAACIAKQGGYKNESLLNCISAFSKVWVLKVEKKNRCPNSTSCCRKDKTCMNAMARVVAGETTFQQLLNVTGGTAANCSFYEGNRTSLGFLPSSRFLPKPWACSYSCKPGAQDANYNCQRYIYECCNPQQIAKGTITYNTSLCFHTADTAYSRTADGRSTVDSKCTAALPPPPPTASPTSPPPSTPTPPPTPATPPPPAKSVTATIKLSTDMSQIPAGTGAH
jgi:hypothetical protein